MKPLIKTIGSVFVTIMLTMSLMSPAIAGQIERPKIHDHYETVIKQIPYQVKVCQDVTTKSGGASSADVIVGAVIGGVIGNQVGKGKGKDAATIFGAIIGAKAAENGKKEIVGYREIEECEIKYTRRLVPMVVGYATTVKIILGTGFDDFVATFETTTQYIVGETVPVRMTLSLD